MQHCPMQINTVVSWDLKIVLISVAPPKQLYFRGTLWISRIPVGF